MISLDSFKPKPVILRTTFKIDIFLSKGISTKVILNAVFSFSNSLGITFVFIFLFSIKLLIFTLKTFLISVINCAISKSVNVFKISII